MKSRQLHGGIWQSRYAGASRNIDSFICIQMVTRVYEGKIFRRQSVSPHHAFLLRRIVSGNNPERESGDVIFEVLDQLLL